MIETTCGQCGGSFPYEASLVVPGTTITCPHCASILELGSTSPPPPEAPPAPDVDSSTPASTEAPAREAPTVADAPPIETSAAPDTASESGAETILVPEYRVTADATPDTGTTLLKSDDVAALTPPTRATMRGFLTQEGLPSGEGDFRLRAESTVVGREQGAIRIVDDAISSRHFEVEERGSEFFLRDLGSRNGTLLNGHPVRSAKLKSGDRITAGNTIFSFSVRHVIPV